MTLLAFTDIDKSYGKARALRSVSLEVRPGEIFGLLGPNGAGKSTLIRILMDIIRADAGTIELFDRPHARQLLDRVGYLPEERGLYQKQKVGDVMTYFAMLKGLGRGEARQRAKSWLERVDLPDAFGWKVDRLSKGMGQKVQIASTLQSEPELCVLDEPFSGLDPINVRLVGGLIRERAEAGRTTILSTHQMNLVEELCDRVALIHEGRLMVYGSVPDVRRQYSPPDVRVRTADPLSDTELARVVEREDAHTTRLRLLDGASVSELASQLVGSGVRLEHFEPVLAPMDEIFVRVVRRSPGAAEPAR